MESLWQEIRRCLSDSVCELDRLIEQMQFLVEKCPGESFDLVSSSLQRAKEKVGRLNEINRIYSRSVSTRPGADRDGNCASLVNEGEFWTIAWDGRIVRMKGSKGVRLLGILIDNPGRQFHVTDLESHGRKSDPSGDDLSFAPSDGCEILDQGAKTAYRHRLVELRDELEEAQRFNDIFRASKIKEEMAILTSELARAFGLYGRSRLALSDAERARVRVTLAVKGAIEKISKYNSPVGWHLATSVRTGAFCLYRPAPIAKGTDGFQGTEI
ncbi:MAG TPA: hypothetical protein VNE82_11400 [Candidatus Binataceae bacterium]|nr:hypothetical protein [Candidatus Binataceae bacterium]